MSSLNVVLWQVCLIEAIICLILLVGIILATSRWRLAIRRAVSGIGKGAVSRAKKEAAARAEREAVARAEKEAARAGMGVGALKRFSSAMAEYATRLKRSTGTVLGYTISSLTKPREKRAAKLERFSSNMAEYAGHLRNHASAINSLTKASQELREEVSRQHRTLSDLAKAIEKAPARVEPKVEPKAKPGIIKEDVSLPEVVSEQTPLMEEELAAKLEKESQIPGHFRYRRQPEEEQKIITKEAPAKKPSLATKHTLATKEVLARKAHLISTMRRT